MPNTNRLQKVSIFFAISFFIGAVACVAWVLLLGDNYSDLIKSSVAAGSFFCFASGAVLYTIGRTNLPSFKLDK